MQLSMKQKSFSQFFATFLKFTPNFENFWKKDMTLITYVFPKLKTAKDVVRQMSKNLRFRTPFNGQPNRGPKTLLKSAWQHLYHIF